MRIQLLAVGGRMPKWVSEGTQVYARRLPPQLRLEIKQVALGHRGGGGDVDRARAREADALLKAVPRGARLVALDESGRRWSTAELAGRLDHWRQQARDLVLMVGGPDGLDRRCLEAAREHWSLGPLTLPHGLVRIVVIEQIYRAWTILSGHPYHRD